MKDITKIKEKLERYYASKCKFCGCDNIAKCYNPDGCECKVAAETKAYLYSIVPYPYYRYTIWDFNGFTNNKMALSPKVINEAKAVLLKYCWAGVKIEDLQENISSKKSLNLDKKSIMDERRDRGTNLLIYSPNEFQTGKTFVASIVMREAIKRRARYGHSAETYDWISFVRLKHLIKKESDEIPHLESCDWLVVDDIPYDKGMTVGSEAFLTSLIDPFFAERLEEGLPTIFVFKFDIDDPGNRWEDKFGMSISSIVKSRYSYKIKLFDKNDR